MSSRNLYPRGAGWLRAVLLLAVPALLAACSSTTPVTTGPQASAPAPAVAAAPAAPARPRHVVVQSGCAHWVSQAECRRVHAEGERLLHASCPANDARCARMEVVAVRRIDTRTSELTVRDRQTGKQTKKRVSLETSAAAAR